MQRLGIALVAAVLATGAYAQEDTRVLPDGSTLTIDRSPGTVTISKEGVSNSGREVSWSRTRTDTGTVSASASASATGTHFAYAKATASTSERVTASGKDIGIAKARAVAIGNLTTSTSATTK
jgi:hypothetical protein